MLRHSLAFPIVGDSLIDKAVLRCLSMRNSQGVLGAACARLLTSAPIFCPVCTSISSVTVEHENLRETCVCSSCGSINRQRQIAWVVCSALGRAQQARGLTDLAGHSDLTVYNTESSRAIHEALMGMPGYRSSEYLGPGVAAGSEVGGIVHQDLQALTYADSSFDLVLSSEILEHVPRPYEAHSEIFRVLKPGGRHVFTVPFDAAGYVDQVRATESEDGTTKFLMDPIYHGDPLRPEGVLVYTIFGLEMLVRLYAIGFRTRVYHLYKPWFGIVGSNAIVFESVKPE